MEDNPVNLTKEELRALVSHSVKETLITLGIDTVEPLEMQKDFQHLREWRESTDSIKKKGLLTIVAILVTGALGAIALGAKAYLKL